MPEAIAAPPTAAPAPPAKAAAPAAAPPVPKVDQKPASTNPPHSQDSPILNQAWADFDDMLAKGAAKAPGETATPPKPAKGKEVPPPGKNAPTAKPEPENPPSEDEPEAEPDVNAKPPDETKSTDKRPGEARWKSARQTIDKLSTELKAAKAKLTQFEEAAKMPKPDPEKEDMAKRLEEQAKRINTLEEEQRFTNYTRSSEYTDQYVKPLESKYAEAQQYATRLKVTDPETQEVRAGLKTDFDTVAQAYLRSPSDGRDLAEQLFGKMADRIVDRVEELQALDEKRQAAINDYQTKGKDRERQQTETRAKQRESLGKLWQESNRAAEEKYPQWFKAIEGDEKGNELLERGRALADKAFGDTSDLAPEQVVMLHSAIRNKAAAFDRLVHQSQQMKARIAELEKSLKDYEESAPATTAVKKTKETPLEGYAAADAYFERVAAVR